ncbi:MAG: GTPase, partial [Candidatus Micrarchaeaceae archaeon]
RLEEKLSELKSEYSKTKYNKATDKHLGILRFKIAKVKRELIEASKRSHGQGFSIRKGGDATVALVGFPNAGKSSLLNALSSAKSKTAQYAFTTLSLVPGMMLYRDSHIQLFDLPGLIEGAHLGKGRGAEVISAVKNADLIVFVVSAENPDDVGALLSELSYFSIITNKKEPDIQIAATEDKIGIKIEVNKSSIPGNAVSEILRNFGIHNAKVRIWDELSEDELISILARKARYVRALVALNKIDLSYNYEEIVERIRNKYNIEVVPISVVNGKNIETLKSTIYEKLRLMRVYLKPELKAESSSPITVPYGCSVKEVARRVHTKLANELKCAYVTGKSVKFPNQKVGAMHVLEDGDVITFVK